MSNVTEILVNWSRESMDNRGHVIATLYEELRRNAAVHLAKERNQPNMQPTLLVNEAYIRLVKINQIDIDGRGQFFVLAGKIMREVLVDEARRARAQKRDTALETQFPDDIISNDIPAQDIIELDELLTRLDRVDPVFVQLFEARAFAGLTIEEAAQQLGLSTSTVKRKWRVALAWLSANSDNSDFGGEPI